MQKGSEGNKEDDNRIDFTSEKDPILIGSNNTSVDQFPAEEVADAYVHQIEGNHFTDYHKLKVGWPKSIKLTQ